ncbi:50S ribosome-binding GTPase [Candidatus Fermentibacterales bacterium]|nr:50S ribosome-binding GTPase [Candidatus Fermentibacterales bacterium]
MDPLRSRGDIIVARATAGGRSALAVVRLSGEGCAQLVEGRMGLDPGRLSGARRAVGLFRSGSGEALDQVVALSWKKGSSYTGEEMVEVICHGMDQAADRIVSAVVEEGGRAALPGEFTRRGLLSGSLTRLDVLVLGRRSAEGQGQGAAGATAGSLLRRLGEVERELEGRLEFGEQYGVGISREEAAAALSELLERATELEGVAAALERPARVVIAGPVNAGKSTLFNTLLGRERVVASQSPGTTRDWVSESAEVEGVTVRLVDTPGEAGGEHEEEAGRVCREEMTAGSDAVLWLSEGGASEPSGWIIDEGFEMLRVSSKTDLLRGPGVNLSCRTGEGLDEIRTWISRRVDLLPGLSEGMTEVRRHLEEAVSALSSAREDMACEEISEARRKLRGIVNGQRMEKAVEAALGMLCVGK